MAWRTSSGSKARRRLTLLNASASSGAEPYRAAGRVVTLLGTLGIAGWQWSQSRLQVPPVSPSGLPARATCGTARNPDTPRLPKNRQCEMSSPGQDRARVTVITPYGQHEVSLPIDIPVSTLLSTGEQPTDTTETSPSHADSGPPLSLPVEPAEQPTDTTASSVPHAGGGTSTDDDALPSETVEPTDGLSPLERVELILPAPVGRATRLAAGAQVLLGRIGWPEQHAADATSSAGASSVGAETIAALERWAESLTEPATGAGSLGAAANRATGAAEPEAVEADEWETGRLLPADLTIGARPTRMESARRAWRELNYLTQLEAMVVGPRMLRCATIAVVSPKGGVGKTTVTALLGTLFSLLRRDPTVAVDTNPDFGSLGRVLTPDQSWYVDDLARLVAKDDELSLTALDSHLGRAIHGLLVVPAPTDPERMAALDESAYRQIIARLKDFSSLILLDCGTGLQDPASAAAIANADQVLLVTDAQPASASLVAESTRLLRQWGRPITVVVNRMPAKGGNLDLQRLSSYLPGARGLIVIPDDMAAATKLASGSFDWRDAPVGWQRAVRRLAAVLVADWPSLGLAR
jgi:MinD-like ATPase involved in chromosome partitioning or flagellar assembly